MRTRIPGDILPPLTPAKIDALIGDALERHAYRELERVDSSSLDVGLLMASGAMRRPAGQPYPLTLTLRQRFLRWVRVRFGRLIYR